MRTRIPWWANPWRSYRRERHRWAVRDARHQDQLQRLAAEAVELRRQLERTKALPGGMSSTEVPEFIFIGIPRPDGSKRLWASKDLTGTAFSMHSDGLEQPRWKIGAVMANSLTVDGAGYGDCIERVLQIWANWLSLAPRIAPPPPPWVSTTADRAIKLSDRLVIDPAQKPGTIAIESGGSREEIDISDKEK